MMNENEVLPYSLEAERVVLKYILVNGWDEEIFSKLSVSDFFERVHKDMYLKLIKRETSVFIEFNWYGIFIYGSRQFEITSVIEFLGKILIASLIDKNQLPVYIDIIRERSIFRQLQNLNAQLEEFKK